MFTEIRFSRAASVIASALTATMALYGCSVVAPSSSRADLGSTLNVTIEGPAGEAYPIEIAIEDETATAISGTTALFGAGYTVDLTVDDQAESFTAIDLATGDGVHIGSDDTGWHLTLSIAGESSTYTSEAELEALDLANNRVAYELLLLSQAAEPMRAELTGGNTPYVAWIPIIIAVVLVVSFVASQCLTTTSKCNGATDVTCPSGQQIHDPCGCGEYTCNRCSGSGCSATCNPDLWMCPENEYLN